MKPLYDQDYDPDDLSVQVSELLVATADSADEAIDQAVPAVLRLLRERMKMDVVFVSEFVDGQRVVRHAVNPPGQEWLPEGAGMPLEESWCQRVVDGRIPELVRDAASDPATAGLPAPFPIGAYLSTPIVLEDGTVYGTLCCFSFSANEDLNERDRKNLRFTAQLAASKLKPRSETRPQAPDWVLESRSGGRR